MITCGNRFTVLILAMLLSACGIETEFDVPGTKTPPAVDQDVLLLQLVDAFKADAMARGVVLPPAPEIRVMKFGKPGEGVLGTCEHPIYKAVDRSTTQWIEIVIDESFARDLYNPDLRVVVYHELIHCLLDKDHDVERGETLMAADFTKRLATTMPEFYTMLDKYLTPGYLATVPNRNY